MKFGNLTSEEIAKNKGKSIVAILPIGSTEEHGAHMPLSTDMDQPLFVVNEAVKKVKGIVYVLPPIPYGNCVSTRNFPGTISVSFDALRAFVVDILLELSRNEIKKVMLISGHAGSMHMAALRNAAELAASVDDEMKIMVLSDYDIAYRLKDKKLSKKIGVSIPEDDGHAGVIETSRMLNVAPSLVKGKEKRKGGTRTGNRFLVTAHPEESIPTGVHGEPKKANAEIGKKIDEYIADELAKLIEELQNA